MIGLKRNLDFICMFERMFFMTNEEKILSLMEKMYIEFSNRFEKIEQIQKEFSSRLGQTQKEFSDRFERMEQTQQEFSHRLEESDRINGERYAEFSNRFKEIDERHKEFINRFEKIEANMATKKDIAEIKEKHVEFENRFEKIEANMATKDDVAEIKEKLARIEEDHGRKIAALFDAREVQFDINNRIMDSLERIENKLDKISLRVAYHDDVLRKVR